MSKKTLLIIAAIAVMLMAATSAYGYYEDWDGWFNSGYLTYGGNEFTSIGGWDVVSDSTIDDKPDDFYLLNDAMVDFVYDGGWYEDTITLGVSGFTGSKPTGQSGQKEGSGGWSGMAILTIPDLPPVVFDTVEGTWDTDDAGDYFDYDSRPDPTYTADWDVTGSVPDGITGGGTCSGHRTYYE